MHVHQAIRDVLVDCGASSIFTVLSSDTMYLVSELEEQSEDFDVYHSRHEQHAVAMADGYSRASDDIGVCVVGRGPGTAQTGTALLTARRKNSNVLIIAADTSTERVYDVKEYDQVPYLDNTVGKVLEVRSVETAVPVLHDALRQVLYRKGPIAVNIPYDILNSKIDGSQDLSIPFDETVSDDDVALSPDDSKLEEVIDIYLDSDASKQPIILAGAGAMHPDSQAAISDLARLTGGLIVTSLQARGLFSGHPYSLGFMGDLGQNLANEYVTQADMIFAVGCSLKPRTTDHGRLFSDNVKIIQIDNRLDPMGQYVSPALSILGDATETVEGINERLRKLDIDFSEKFWTKNLRNKIASTPPLDSGQTSQIDSRMDPRDVVRSLDSIFPDERLIVCDGGHFMGWVLDGITLQDPSEFIWTLDFAAIGLGLPMGLGAGLEETDKMCVVFCGDAGALMSLSEFETAIRYDVPIAVVIMNDDALGAEYKMLAKSSHSPNTAEIASPDFEGLFESLGGTAYTARSTSDLQELDSLLCEPPTSPILLDCKVDREITHRAQL